MSVCDQVPLYVLLKATENDDCAEAPCGISGWSCRPTCFPQMEGTSLWTVEKIFENDEPVLELFSYADRTSDSDTRRSESGAAIFFGGWLGLPPPVELRRLCRCLAQSQKRMQPPAQ